MASSSTPAQASSAGTGAELRSETRRPPALPAGEDTYHAPYLQPGVPPIPGLDVPLPADIARMTSRQLWGPVSIAWWHMHTTARLQWAKDNDVDLSLATVSRVTGLIDFKFPGIEDMDFLPPDVPDVEHEHPDDDPEAVALALWGEFLDSIKSLKSTPACWRDLVDAVVRWSTGSDPDGDDELWAIAAATLREFLIHTIPLHLTYILLPTCSPGKPTWLAGHLGQGRVTITHLDECPRWTTEGCGDMEIETLAVTGGLERLPSQARKKLASMFDSCAPQAFPRIFRHLFGRDYTFQHGLAKTLAEKYGRYEEVDFAELIVPLPWGSTDQPLPKRARSEESGLISFA